MSDLISAYLNQTGQLKKRKAGYDLYGKSLYYDPVSVPARIQRRQRQVRSKEGEVAMSDATVYLRSDADAALDDIFIDDVGVSYYVMGLAAIQGLQSASHVEVYLGRVPRGG